jgi:hypothetical protein
MKQNNWNDENIPVDSAFISICCQPEIKKNYLEAVKHETDEHWFKSDHDNVLNVDFDDILMEKAETKYGMAYGMSEADAKKIIQFIENNKEKQNWYIHCRSGKSRSVATGMFIKKYLKEKHNIDVRPHSDVHGVFGLNGYMFDLYCKTAGLKDNKVA